MVELGGARRLKINPRLNGQPCGWCSEALVLGEDGVVCEACETPHHAGHWDGRNGCSNPVCINKPLMVEETKPEEARRELPADWMYCPHCTEPIWAGNALCPKCGMAPTADGVYRGPKETAPKAKTALIQAIVSFFICAPILAPMAIRNARDAMAIIDTDPRYEGRGMASTAQVLGVIALVLWGVAICARFSSR